MNNKPDIDFYYTVIPTKLTEARRLKLHTEGWGLLTDYNLESVKICRYKGRVSSTATIRISDRSGQVTCVAKGPCIGLLFGLTAKEWEEVANMCNNKDQIFYRYFKSGINKSFSCEQKIFYNFCMTNQKNDVLVAKYRRSVNMRNKFKSDAFLDIVELKKCDNNLLDLYLNYLRANSDKLTVI